LKDKKKINKNKIQQSYELCCELKVPSDLALKAVVPAKEVKEFIRHPHLRCLGNTAPAWQPRWLSRRKPKLTKNTEAAEAFAEVQENFMKH
jgi:hypothetical protein